MDKSKDSNIEYLNSLFNEEKINICVGEKNNFFIIINSSYIKLNENLYKILEYIKYEKDYNKIKYIENYESFSNLCDLLRRKDNQNYKESYIHFKIRLLDKNIVNFISIFLSKLFSIKIFKYLLVLSLIFNFIFYYFYAPSYRFDFTVSDLSIYYALLIFIMIMHEFGHSAASKYYGINPSDIGLGIYMFFPVFFANVTDIWLLSKNKRLVVNLGGIYFQLIINIFIITINYFYNNDILTKIIHVNVFVICYTLVPFLRNDGYWIYSDYFNIPNLSQKSKYYSLSIFINYMKKKKIIINYPLLIYSIGNSLFFLFIIYSYLKLLIFNINTFDLYSNTYKIIIKICIIISITFFFIVFIKRNIISFSTQIKILFK